MTVYTFQSTKIDSCTVHMTGLVLQLLELEIWCQAVAGHGF